MSYVEAKEKYARFGIDTEKALQTLKEVSISVHCWQGDDVVGFDSKASRWKSASCLTSTASPATTPRSSAAPR